MTKRRKPTQGPYTFVVLGSEGGYITPTALAKCVNARENRELVNKLKIREICRVSDGEWETMEANGYMLAKSYEMLKMLKHQKFLLETWRSELLRFPSAQMLVADFDRQIREIDELIGEFEI